MKSTTAMKVLLLVAVMVVSFVIGACAPNKDINDALLTSQPDLDDVSYENSQGETSDEVSVAPEGYANAPVIADVINITPQQIIITGTCDEGCEVTVTDGVTDVTTKSSEGYFVLEYTIDTTNFVVLSATAKSETLKESEITSFRVSYNSTAMKRIDGYGVTVGEGSAFYYDKDLAYYTGIIHEINGTTTSTLLTQTQIASFKKAVNTKVKTFNQRAGEGANVEMIYVLIPNAISIYPERLKEGTVQENYSTRYEQVVKALNESNATVIDMSEAFKKAKENGDKIYYSTDSHLTEYGGYLVYKTLMDHIDDRFPEAAARDLESDFTAKETVLKGGNISKHLGVNTSVVKEASTIYTPKFSLNIGREDTALTTAVDVISNFKKYNEDDSMLLASGVKDLNSRILLGTNRPKLPCALIYRDDYAVTFSDILAERFNRCLLEVVDRFIINMTDAQRYYGVKEDGKNKVTVDYIIVVVSESNLDKIIG